MVLQMIQLPKGFSKLEVLFINTALAHLMTRPTEAYHVGYLHHRYRDHVKIYEKVHRKITGKVLAELLSRVLGREVIYTSREVYVPFAKPKILNFVKDFISETYDFVLKIYLEYRPYILPLELFIYPLAWDVIEKSVEECVFFTHTHEILETLVKKGFAMKLQENREVDVEVSPKTTMKFVADLYWLIRTRFFVIKARPKVGLITNYVFYSVFEDWELPKIVDEKPIAFINAEKIAYSYKVRYNNLRPGGYLP